MRPAQTQAAGVSSADGAKADLKTARDAAQFEGSSKKELGKRVKQLERKMLEHARNLESEQAARVRDRLALLREQAFGANVGDRVPPAAQG